MAYDSTLGMEDEKKDEGTQVASSGNIIQGSGQTPFKSNQTGSGSWTNLQNYLDANQGTGEGMANRLIDQEVNKPIEDMGNFQDQFNQAQQRYENEYEVYDPNQAYNNLFNNQEQAIGRLSHQFNTPQGYQQKDFSEVQQNVDQLKTETGRLNALQTLNPKSTIGQRTLDNLFMQRQAGNVFEDLNIDNAVNQDQQLSNQFNEWAQGRQQQATASQQGLQDLVNQNLNNFNTSNQEALNRAQQQRQSLEQGLRNRINTGTATPQDLAMVGIDPANYNYLVSNMNVLPTGSLNMLGDNVVNDMPELNFGNVVDADTLNTQNILRNVANQGMGQNNRIITPAEQGLVDLNADYYGTTQQNLPSQLYDDVIQGQVNTINEWKLANKLGASDKIGNAAWAKLLRDQAEAQGQENDTMDYVLAGNLISDITNKQYDDSRYDRQYLGIDNPKSYDELTADQQRSLDFNRNMMDDQGNVSDEARLLLDRIFKLANYNDGMSSLEGGNITGTNPEFSYTMPNNTGYTEEELRELMSQGGYKLVNGELVAI